MNGAFLHIGTQIAEDLHDSTERGMIVPTPVKVTGDLLAVLQRNPPPSFPMLKTTCGLLGTYLNLPGDRIPLETIDDKRKGFRKFLVDRNYAENSIRSYVNQVRLLLRLAAQFGWHPDDSAPDSWRPLLLLAAEKKLMDIARHFSRVANTPGDVTLEDVDHWGESRIQDGIFFTAVAAKKNRFWRLLQRTGWTTLNPPRLMNLEKHGIPLHQLSPGLRNDIETVLKWKQAAFAPNRPKWGKVRAVSANNLRLTICQLAGFAINNCGTHPISLKDLVQKDLVEGFVEWAINEKGLKGRSVQPKLGMVAAVMKHHPSYTSSDYGWLKLLIDSIPVEDESERKQRKAEKYVDYEVLETLPSKIRGARETSQKRKRKNPKRAARMAMEELMIRWLLVLPWRQRNLRECRISGAAPNLYKGKIPRVSELDKPTWVIEEETRNVDAEFWQIRFSSKETKTGIAVNVLLPRQLVEPLEEYLKEYRPHLLAGRTTETLFLNQVGKPLRADLIVKIVGHWSLQCCGVRTTPHLFRDSVAFKWLKEHPKDYLTLSKMLWHKNVQTTIQIYGARFNESSGVCAMEAWLNERQLKAT